MMSRVAVVILNWNGLEFLTRFLGDIVAYSTLSPVSPSGSGSFSDSGCLTDCGPMVEVVVADNGSTDGSLEYLESFNAQLSGAVSVRVIKLTENYGFSGGYNRALSQIDSDYYLLLNSDIQVTKGYLEPLFELMERREDVAAVMPKMLSLAQPTMFEYAGASGGFIDTLGYPFCRGRLINQTEVDGGQYDSEREIFWATGAAFFVRSADYWAVGGLDDLFFAHMEEIDLCWRLKRMGRKIMVAPSSVVYHVGGGTLPAWSSRKTYLNFRNNLAMLYKNLSWTRFIAVYCVRFMTDSLRALSYLVGGHFDFVAAIVRGHRDFWKSRSKYDRQQHFPRKRVRQIYRGSIVLRYFFNKKFDDII